MPAMDVTAPLPAAKFEEPTHRFGRALDDRLPLSGMAPANASPIHTASVAPGGNITATDEDGFSFNDLLDIVNPLQHLPVVSTLYREFTGDEIRPESRVVGGGIFGGIIGAAASLMDVAVEELSGDTMGGHVMTALFGDEEAEPPKEDDLIQVAADRSTDTPLPVPATAGTPAPTAATTTAATRTKQPIRPEPTIPDNKAPGLQTLSPAAFDTLLQSFGAPAKPDDEAPGRPGFAYAKPPAPSGRLVNEAL